VQSPDGTKCWYHSSMLMPDNKSAGSYVAVFRRPYAPTSLAAKGTPAGVELSWTPHALRREVKGYHVYRGDAKGENFAALTMAPVAGTAYVDKTAKPGTPCTYMVTSEEWSRLESTVSSPVILVTGQNNGASGQPLREAGLSGWDKTPPEPPADLTLEKAGPGQYRLTWKASPAADLRHYNLYASSQGRPAIEQKRLLVSPPAGETAYLDWTAPVTGAVHYALVAADRQGNLSAPAFVSAE